MKKILFGFAVLAITLTSAQNYPDYYPNNGSNNGYYGDYDDEYWFPDDYYYQYPDNYYTSDYYQSYYNDYRNSIADINWNRFFRRYQLGPWQIQQIIMLNEMYPSFSAWNNYYRYNPDRWYYDRFYALERILGPRVFVVFQNRYYGGYSPVQYYQQYRRQHYASTVYIIPQYRNINIDRYRVDRVQYNQANPHPYFGFGNGGRNGNNGIINSNNGGFRNDANTNQGGFRNDKNTNTGGGFRNDTNSNKSGFKKDNSTNADGFRNDSNTNSGGFRNNSTPNNNGTLRNDSNSNSGGFRSTPKVQSPSSDAGSGSGGFRNNQSSTGFRSQFSASEANLRNTPSEQKIQSNSSGFKPSEPAAQSSGRRFSSH